MHFVQGTAAVSPVADLLFIIAMWRFLLHHLDKDWLAHCLVRHLDASSPKEYFGVDAADDYIGYPEAHTKLGHVSYIDDLEIRFVGNAVDIVAMVRQATLVSLTVLNSFSLQLNLSSGQTNALIRFAGLGSTDAHGSLKQVSLYFVRECERRAVSISP